MSKKEFISMLDSRLSLIGVNDKEDTLEYYSEMIDDLKDNGMSEEDAVLSLGSIDEIISKIISEASITELIKARVKPNRTLKVWEIILLILGFPLWFPLTISFFVIFLSIYIVIWSAVISLYSAVAGLLAGGVGLIIGMIIIAFTSGVSPSLLFLLGIALASFGIGIILLIGTNQVTRGVIWLSKKILFAVKSCFVKKER